MRARRRAAPARPGVGRARRRAGSGTRASRRSPCACSTPTPTPTTSATWPAALRARAARRPRRRVGRRRARVPGVRAGVDGGRRRVPGPGGRPLPAPAGAIGRRARPARARRDAVERRRVRACDEAAAHPVRLLLSGPAGGVAAVSALGTREAVSFDMGGTSTRRLPDPRRRGGQLARSGRSPASRCACRTSTSTPSARAAASIAWLDEGGALRVGPQSAGADPGPAAYGRGGRLPTVTDANVVLGRLDPTVPHRRRAARSTRGPRGRRCGRSRAPFRSVRAAAEGVIAVANEEMVRAIRVVSVEQGHDPRGLELVAFGGAGPLHACDVADLLGMRRGRRAGGGRRALGARDRGGRPAHATRSRA